MKTSKKVRIKFAQLGILILFVVCTQSCDTEIPPVDLEPPSFRFEITGDGFNQAFDQDTDFDSFQLNLREDVEYDFIFSGGDPDGMSQIQWQFTTPYVELTSAIPNRWETSTVGLNTFINWFGDAANPVTGAILTGSFIAKGDVVNHVFNFMARDYGGDSPIGNTTFGSLNIYSGSQPTGIGN